MRKVFLPPTEIVLPGVSSGPGLVPFRPKPGRRLPTPGCPRLSSGPRAPGFSATPSVRPFRPKVTRLPQAARARTCFMEGTPADGSPSRRQATDRHNLLEVTEDPGPEIAEPLEASGRRMWLLPLSHAFPQAPGPVSLRGTSSRIKAPPRLVN